MEFNDHDGLSVIKAQEITDPNDYLWKQYKVFVDLFKFYLSTAVKANIWFYTVTGAILTYYFGNSSIICKLKYSLILPIILGLGFGIIFLLSSRQAKDMKSKLNYIKSELHLPGAPHTDVLINFLNFAGILFILIALIILGFFLEG